MVHLSWLKILTLCIRLRKKYWYFESGILFSGPFFYTGKRFDQRARFVSRIWYFCAKTLLLVTNLSSNKCTCPQKSGKKRAPKIHLSIFFGGTVKNIYRGSASIRKASRFSIRLFRNCENKNSVHVHCTENYNIGLASRHETQEGGKKKRSDKEGGFEEVEKFPHNLRSHEMSE